LREQLNGPKYVGLQFVPWPTGLDLTFHAKPLDHDHPTTRVHVGIQKLSVNSQDHGVGLPTVRPFLVFLIHKNFRVLEMWNIKLQG
jgi:hypothetical protein